MNPKIKIRNEYPLWLQRFARWCLKALGWELMGERSDLPKIVYTAAPHATNWDLLFMLLVSFAHNIPSLFTMKDTLFVWPLSPLWYWLGGVPINRRSRTNLVDQMIATFDSYDRMSLVIPPEGTRKDVRYWKTGFYWIALGAGAAVVPAFINYEKKFSGLSEPIILTGNFEEDFKRIADFYEMRVGIRPQYDPTKIQQHLRPATEHPQTAS